MDNILRGILMLSMGLAGLVSLSAAHAASFNCTKARTNVEKMICTNNDLSNLDMAMSVSYKLDLIFPSEVKWVKATQLHWLKQRDRCKDVECLKKAYLSRINELNNPPGYEGNWVVDKNYPGLGKNTPFCRALLHRLRSFKWKNDGCAWNVISTFPGLKQPHWKKLDPNKHIGLIYKLLMVSGADWFKYFKNGRQYKAIPITNNRQIAKRFIDNGGELLVWKARLLDYLSDNKPAPPGKQTYVELRTNIIPSKSNESCPNKPEAKWWGSTYMVTSDLSGPVAEIDPGYAFALQMGVFLQYKGNTYLFGPDGAITRMSGSGYKTFGWPTRYCGFRYKLASH